MPKRSKEDTEITIQLIMEAAVDQILRLGYDKMSYTTLSQQTGISRTGISHHFPRKTDFAVSLNDSLIYMFITHLEFEKSFEDFANSWIEGLSNSEFIAILRLFFHHIVAAEDTHEFALKGIAHISSLVEQTFGFEFKSEMEQLVGKSLIEMSRV